MVARGCSRANSGFASSRISAMRIMTVGMPAKENKPMKGPIFHASSGNDSHGNKPHRWGKAHRNRVEKIRLPGRRKCRKKVTLPFHSGVVVRPR